MKSLSQLSDSHAVVRMASESNETQIKKLFPHVEEEFQNILTSFNDLIVKRFTDLSKDVESSIQDLEKKQADWNLVKQEMQVNASKAKEKIKFDVGGKIFAISKTALLSIQGTFFSDMLCSGEMQPDDDGTYFIDRNPELFDRILDFLRHGVVDTKGLDDVAKEKLRKEFEHYRVPIPESASFGTLTLRSSAAERAAKFDLQFDASLLPPTAVLSNNGKTVSKVGKIFEWDTGVLGTAPVSQVSFRIDDKGKTGYIMLGLAPKDTFNPTSVNYASSGFYICAKDGALFAQGGINGKPYAAPMTNGDVVNVTYNTETSQIVFAINGKSFGAAYTNVTGEFYPAIEMYHPGTTVTLVGRVSSRPLIGTQNVPL